MGNKNIILDSHKKRSDFVWKRLLKGEKILSDEEAVELDKIVKELRL